MSSWQKTLFQNFPLVDWQWLHIFLPLARLHEPDTWLIIRRIWEAGLPLRLAAPVVQPDGSSLKSYELQATTALRPNRWGIAEPLMTATSALPAQLFDAVLVPLLVCDQSGQRVGYGGGFYDRFLTECRPDTMFIGLNVLDEPPITAIADVLPTDIPLNAYITPSWVWQF